MKKYSKREFLKFLGLGIAFAPFVSLYSACDGTPATKEKDNSPKESIEPIDDSTDISKASVDDVILLKRDDKEFSKFNLGFNGRIKKLPKYIAVCKTTLGVQFAIALARKEHLPIAVKSGGHSFEGFSSNDEGLVINLSQMKKTEWLDENTIAIEPGCLLQEIQSVTFAQKRLIPSGSCGTVGIAGLTLGGGYGFFSRKYGFTCDNLIDVEFIDGLGKSHKASEHKDLFWALRGGGNGNYGVATKFIFKTHPMPQNFAAHVLKFRNLDAVRFSTLLETWFECTKTFANEAFCAFVLNGKTLTILATTFGDINNLESNISKLIAMADSKSFSNTALPQAMKRYYGRTGPILFKNASAGLYKGHEDIAGVAKQIFEKVVAAKGMIYQINTLGGKINDANFENQSCYPHRALPYLSELQAYWENSNQESKLLDAFESIQSVIKQQGINAQYRNYPDINFTNWQEAYYGNNYGKLLQIKNQLDPDNIFQYPQCITNNAV